MIEKARQPDNRNVILIAAIFMVGGFVVILNQTVLFTALPDIMQGFQISANTVQWLTTGYMMMNGILIPVTAFLVERYTTRQLMICAMGLFIAGTVLAAGANNFTLLLLARIIQACGAGITMPLMQIVFFKIFPREKRGTALGMVGLVVGFAPAIGPTLSGFILSRLSWRYIFLMVLPVAILVLLFSIIYLKNVSKVNKALKIDKLSVILSTIGFGALLYGVSIAGSNGQRPLTVCLWLLAGAIGIALLIIRELRMKKPMLEFRVFKSYTFVLTTILVIFSFVSLMGPQNILPIYVQSMRHMSALDSGLILLPGAIANGIVSLIAGAIYDRIGGKYLGVIGFLIIAVSTIPFLFLQLGTPIWLIIIFNVLTMIGISMVMMTLTTEGLNALPDHLINHGTAMNNTFRQVGGSIGTALLISIYTQAANHALASGKTMNRIEAQVHGTSYLFLGVAVISVIGIVISFLLKSGKEGSRESANETS